MKIRAQRVTYLTVEENVWVRPFRRGYRWCCCDCGLVHVVDFTVKRGVLTFRVRRHNRATAAVRRRQLAR
jgi:hypothetical protein